MSSPLLVSRALSSTFARLRPASGVAPPLLASSAPPLLSLPAPPLTVPRRGLKVHRLEMGEERHIVYKLIPGQQAPTLVYVPGLHSYAHMNGFMAQCLLRFCDINQYGCVVYDHECMGESKGELGKVVFTHWVEDLTKVIDDLTEGPLVLLGLSVGGWLSLIGALERPDRIHGLLLYAPALNYAYPYYRRHYDSLSESTKKKLNSGEIHMLKHAFGDALLKRDFAEDSRKYEIDLDKKLDINCPVRILHGLNDSEVHPDKSMQLCKQIVSENVDLIYRKTSPHQAASPTEIELVLSTLDRLLKDNPVRNWQREDNDD